MIRNLRKKIPNENTNSPGSNQHQNHGKNTQQEHDEELHDPQGYPTKDDQGRSEEGPAHTYIKKINIKM